MSEKQRIKRQVKRKHLQSVQVKTKMYKIDYKLKEAFVRGQISILIKVKTWLQLELPKTGAKLMNKFEKYLISQK